MDRLSLYIQVNVEKKGGGTSGGRGSEISGGKTKVR